MGSDTTYTHPPPTPQHIPDRIATAKYTNNDHINIATGHGNNQSPVLPPSTLQATAVQEPHRAQYMSGKDEVNYAIGQWLIDEVNYLIEQGLAQEEEKNDMAKTPYALQDTHVCDGQNKYNGQ